MRVQRLHHLQRRTNTVRIYFLYVTLIYNVYEVVEFSLLSLIEATNWSLGCRTSQRKPAVMAEAVQ
jgi:hypothetical protein